MPVKSLTGARCVATLLHEMKRRGKDCRFGVVSMCIGKLLSLLLYTLTLAIAKSVSENALLIGKNVCRDGDGCSGCV